MIKNNGDLAFYESRINSEETSGYPKYTFSDDSEQVVSKIPASAHLRDITQFKGQNGLFKSYYDGISKKTTLSITDYDAGSEVTTPENTKIEVQEIAQNGIMITKQGLWQNGRILDNAEIFGQESSEWNSVKFESISDSGGFVAATAINTSTSERHKLVLFRTDIAVDNNRDGEVNFNSTDATSETQPHTFWVNDDNDGTGVGSENAGSSTKDYSDGQLASKRDLEDLSRIHLEVSSVEDQLISGDLQLGLKWKNTTGSPSVRLYLHSDILGGTGYITDDSAAGLQTGIAYKSALQSELGGSTLGTSGTFVFKKSFFTTLSGSEIKPLLFEGSGEGSGELTMVLLDKNDQEIGKGPSVWLNLENIKNMYVRGRADWPSGIDLPHEYAGPVNDPPEPNLNFVFDVMGYPFDQPWYETEDTIFFVHGWNQSYEKSRNFAETSFKRLYHSGFKGRFAMLRWPTFVGEFTYNDSDYRAWKSGRALEQFVNSVPGGNKNIMAHSMGNIVVGSALQQGLNINNYALINAAVSASCYDLSTSLEQGWSWASSSETPDLSTEYGFRGYLSNISGNLVNYYLEQDFALGLWNDNNRFFKPQRYNTELPIINTTGYYYDENESFGNRLGITFLVSESRYVRTNHEAMGYVSTSKTLAVGAESSTQGSVSRNVDLETYGYSDPGEHSGPWNHTIQNMSDFYEDLLVDFDIFQF